MRKKLTSGAPWNRLRTFDHWDFSSALARSELTQLKKPYRLLSTQFAKQATTPSRYWKAPPKCRETQRIMITLLRLARKAWRAA